MTRLITEPFDVYRAKATDNVSSHALSDFRECPAHFRRKELGLAHDVDSKSYKIGRATHVLSLEGQAKYEAEYTVGDGPINPTTGKPYGTTTKAFEEWIAAQPGEILTTSEAVTVERAAMAVREHPIASGLIDGRGQAEGVARAVYAGVPCQARIDYLTEHGDIVDLKTTRTLDGFEQMATDYGYIQQLAFYRGVAEAAGIKLSGMVYLVATETTDRRGRCGVWFISPDCLDAAAIENRIAIRNLSACRAMDSWPTGYEELRTYTRNPGDRI